MREGLDRVKELVLDLRTFSRLDEGEFQFVDVVETIDAVLLLLKHKMNGRIHVEKHFAPARTLCCHAGRLHQVLMNLIANAVDAIAGEGTVIITTSQTSDLFLISVRDTGAGIPEAIRSKIFDPFFTTKPVGRGTGLGLAISYGIVQEHGGSIEVQSEEGVGTELDVYKRQVVYETVHRLQGDVTLRPKESPGASFLLSVPLSVSTTHLLLLSCAGQTFGTVSYTHLDVYKRQV